MSTRDDVSEWYTGSSWYFFYPVGDDWMVECVSKPRVKDPVTMTRFEDRRRPIEVAV